MPKFDPAVDLPALAILAGVLYAIGWSLGLFP